MHELRHELEQSYNAFKEQIAVSNSLTTLGGHDSSGLTVSEQESKIISSTVKVELALSDALNSKDFSEQSINTLTALIRDYPRLEPKLKSVCYQKLGSLQFEFLDTNFRRQLKKAEQERISEQFEQIVDNCAKAT